MVQLVKAALLTRRPTLQIALWGPKATRTKAIKAKYFNIMGVRSKWRLFLVWLKDNVRMIQYMFDLLLILSYSGGTLNWYWLSIARSLEIHEKRLTQCTWKMFRWIISHTQSIHINFNLCDLRNPNLPSTIFKSYFFKMWSGTRSCGPSACEWMDFI